MGQRDESSKSENNADVLRHTVLLYEEYGLGTWVKIPEFDLQALTEDPEFAIGQLEELLFWELRQREGRGERIPERTARTIKHVDKDEYGPTQLELDEERVQRELGEEPGLFDDEDDLSKVRLRVGWFSWNWEVRFPEYYADVVRDKSIEGVFRKTRGLLDDIYFSVQDNSPMPYSVSFDIEPGTSAEHLGELKRTFEKIFGDKRIPEYKGTMPNQSPNEERPQGEAEKGDKIPADIRREGLFGDVIFASSRRQAIADGVLVDVSETAKEAGFRIPVALTRAVWAEYVAVPEGVIAQDEAGRLWDILWMARTAIISRSKGTGPKLTFQLHVRNDNREGIPPLVTLKAVCGPDDDGSPCLTVMLPDED